MGLFARVAGCAAMLGLVACAAIAGLESPPELEVTDGTKSPDRPNPDPTSPSTNNPPQQPQNADATTNDAADAAPVSDAAKEADATPPPCTKTPNGGGCQVETTCCSGKCNEAKTCAGDCRSGGSSCDPLASAPCCIGLYCTGFCIPCIGPGGTAADNLLGGKNAKSCCSRMVGATGTCQ